MDMSQHPSADGAAPHEAPASAGARATPNLPALISAIPGDHTRAPQTEFVRARQVVFLENLSVTGSARSAACAAGVSHQSAYRARRGQGHFRLAWDAALVAARAHAADTLACRAIDGIEEKVFYHGEEIATRTRYSDRLLLAHLARLDKHAADGATRAFAEDWDAAMARFAAGEAVVAGPSTESKEVPACAGNQGASSPCSPAQAGASAGTAQPPEKNSPGPCNTWSMSPSDDEDDHDDGERSDLEWEALYEAMEEARPLNAPPPELLSDPDAVEACQIEAFEMRDEDWWRYGENFACFAEGEDGVWRPEPEDYPDDLPPIDCGTPALEA